MKQTTLTMEELATWVPAVPPLARRNDLSVDDAANRQLIRHIESGGIRTLLYGGNANLYHMPLREYAPMLAMLADAAGPDTRVIPAVGPDFGKMIEQVDLLRDSGYQTAMVLPMQGFTTPQGVADGFARFVDRAGMPVTLKGPEPNAERYTQQPNLSEVTFTVLAVPLPLAKPVWFS